MSNLGNQDSQCSLDKVADALPDELKKSIIQSTIVMVVDSKNNAEQIIDILNRQNEFINVSLDNKGTTITAQCNNNNNNNKNIIMDKPGEETEKINSPQSVKTPNPNPKYTSKDLYEEERKSEQKAIEINKIQNQVNKTINTFVKVFSNYEKNELIKSMPDLYSNDAFLNDRIMSVYGLDEISNYFENSFDKLENIKFEISDVVLGKKEAYIHWIWKLNDSDLLGISRIRFNEEGKIIYQQDYWDYSELIKENSILKPLINLAKSRS